MPTRSWLPESFLQSITVDADRLGLEIFEGGLHNGRTPPRHQSAPPFWTPSSMRPLRGPPPAAENHLAESWPELSRPNYHLLLSAKVWGWGPGRLPRSTPVVSARAGAKESGGIPKLHRNGVGDIQYDPEPLLPV